MISDGSNNIFLIKFSFNFREEVEETAKRLKLKLFRASVKENFNIEECKYNCLVMMMTDSFDFVRFTPSNTGNR